MPSIINRAALGRHWELGSLYDARSGEGFSGVSPWESTRFTPQADSGNSIQRAVYSFSTSIKESRKSSGLTAEGALELELGLVKAEGSASYLSNDSTSRYEARLDVSCTVVRRTRQIPQEAMHDMPYISVLDCSKYTHFVAAVTEGGTATLTFRKECQSEEEERRVAGHLETKIRAWSGEFGPNVDLKLNKKDISSFENVQISYSGAITEPVANIEDALRVARDLPAKLQQQMNTLSVELMPISVLKPGIQRIVRQLDESTIRRLEDALAEKSKLSRALEALLYPSGLRIDCIISQITNMRAAFDERAIAFQELVRLLLPELRDGSLKESDLALKMNQLSAALQVFERCIRSANEFIEIKDLEARYLESISNDLAGFHNRLGSREIKSLVGSDAPTYRFILSLGDPQLTRSEHPLQRSIRDADKEPDPCDEDGSDEESDDSSESEDDDEWYKKTDSVMRIKSSSKFLRQLQLVNAESSSVTFEIDIEEKAYPPSGSQSKRRLKRKKTHCGDVIFDNGQRLIIVTGHLPTSPTDLVVTAFQETPRSLQVAWNPVVNNVFPTEQYRVRYRPRPNRLLDTDGQAPIMEDEPFNMQRCEVTSLELQQLRVNTDYEVQVQTVSAACVSPWSPSVVCRTERPVSVARKMIEFYHSEKERLQKTSVIHCDKKGGRKPWDLEDGALYLGNHTIDAVLCSIDDYRDETAVKTVNVAPEFAPEIPLPHNFDDSRVILFTGPSGHGKSTQINALISYLLGGDFDDSARIMTIDDRNAPKQESITKYITIYVIRPFSDLFQGKTLLIIDTPGYGDTSGLARDRFVTAAMQELFRVISFVNAVVFTCKATENKTTLLKPVVAFVFQLFAKDVRSCLRLVITHGTLAAPQALRPMRSLGWPIQDSLTVKVDNAAFVLSSDEPDPMVRDYWVMSMTGQHRVLDMLMQMTPVPTEKSAQVTNHRLKHEKLSRLTLHRIYRSAEQASQCAERMNAISRIVENPHQPVEITTTEVRQIDLPAGSATTLCRICHKTCHEDCAYFKDEDKGSCGAMLNGICMLCKCPWQNHCNSTFILKPEVKTKKVYPKELMKSWNKETRTAEGALKDAIEDYLKIHSDLQDGMKLLIEITDTLQQSALQHNPGAFINYIDLMIEDAKILGSPPAHIAQLQTAKETYQIASEVAKGRKGDADHCSVVGDVLTKVNAEMQRRTALDGEARALEEKKACQLYNDLMDQLPQGLRSAVRESQTAGGTRHRAPKTYAENLKAVVELVTCILKQGRTVAAFIIRQRGGK